MSHDTTRRIDDEQVSVPDDMPADMPDQRAPRARRRSRGVPVLAAVAALGVAVATPTLLGGDDAPTAGARPPNLALLSLGDSTALERRPAGAGAGPGVTYRRTGSWPAAPSSAAVQRPTGPGDVAVVERLARALRLPGSPVTNGAVWTVVSDDGATLRVARTTGAWTYVRDGDASCLPVSVDPAAGPDSVAGCAVPAPRPARPPAQVSRERAVATADPVLRALGHDPAAARTTPGELAHVELDPVVAGLPTSGHRTAVGVDERGIRWAHGWLGGVRAGATYPLVTAQSAYAAMTADTGPQPAIGCAEPGSAGGTRPVPAVPDLGCGPRELTITGARLGLASRQDAGGPVLVPAWLFDVAASDAPIVHLAVAPEYLQSAPYAGPDGGPDGTPPTGPDGGPAGVAPGAPGQEPGVEPSR